jgi:hypothetical protein
MNFSRTNRIESWELADSLELGSKFWGSRSLRELENRIFLVGTKVSQTHFSEASRSLNPLACSKVLLPVFKAPFWHNE